MLREVGELALLTDASKQSKVPLVDTPAQKLIISVALNPLLVETCFFMWEIQVDDSVLPFASRVAFLHGRSARAAVEREDETALLTHIIGAQSSTVVQKSSISLSFNRFEPLKLLISLQHRLLRSEVVLAQS